MKYRMKYRIYSSPPPASPSPFLLCKEWRIKVLWIYKLLFIISFLLWITADGLLFNLFICFQCLIVLLVVVVFLPKWSSALDHFINEAAEREPVRTEGDVRVSFIYLFQLQNNQNGNYKKENNHGVIQSLKIYDEGCDNCLKSFNVAKSDSSDHFRLLLVRK